MGGSSSVTFTGQEAVLLMIVVILEAAMQFQEPLEFTIPLRLSRLIGM